MLGSGGEALMLDTEGRRSRWLRFRDPAAVLVAHRVADVPPLLAEVEREVANGSWAAGFLAYEAAPAFDAAFEAHPPGALPLAWWGLFRRPREVPPPAQGCPADLVWRPTLSRRRYGEAVARIRSHIAAGDTYQVNYTFPLEASIGDTDPGTLFAALHHAQGGRYSAYLDCGRFAVCSASPELFFALCGGEIVARPMKGTARRGRCPEEDRRRAEELLRSEKDRAENVMIVDMMRNDLGKVARPGSVRVRRLFTLETFPTVHQLTSTVSAETAAPVSEILRALFPCASITGAPKISTMRIIRRLEAGPRGVYTGAVGFLAPARSGRPRRAQLNVAIRTAAVDRVAGVARYGTGGGIVWDSQAESEYQECRTKALVLTAPRLDRLAARAPRPPTRALASEAKPR